MSDAKTFEPADIAAIVSLDDPRVSPDGAQVAVTYKTTDLDANEYRSAIWLVAVLDGTHRPLTAGEHCDVRPRWSPDGTRLAYVSHHEDTGSQLFLLRLDGGEPIQLASMPEEIDEVAWAPDGNRLAFTARVRDEEMYGPEKTKDRPARRLTRLYSRLDGTGWVHDRAHHVFVVDAAGAEEAVQVTSGDREYTAPAWSPDGRKIVVCASLHDDWDIRPATDLVLVDPGAPEAPPRILTDTDAIYAMPAWSPSGDRIACYRRESKTDPRDFHATVIESDGSSPRDLTGTLDRQCRPFPSARAPIWDGDRVLFAAEESGDVNIYGVDSSNAASEPVRVSGGGVTVTGFDAASGVIVATAMSAISFSNLHVVDESAPGALRNLASVGDDFLDAVAPVAPIPFTAVSADGSVVSAWFVPPVGAAPGERRPAVLNIHGGPYTQYGNRYHDEFQVQAGAGFGVIYANPRGSSGYGEAWGRAIRGPMSGVDPGTGWGGVDYEDLMAVVEAAVASFDVVDPDRLAVMGGSYGGYMTTWIIGHDHRFKAAISERAVNNVLTLEATSDIAGIFSRQLGVSHLVAPEEYRRISPIEFVNEITTPVLILHSEDDLRCPIEQAEQLFVALRLREHDVEFVRFPGEGHELSRSGAPRHRVQRAEIVLEWLQRWLG